MNLQLCLPRLSFLIRLQPNYTAHQVHVKMEAYAKKRKIIINVNVKMDIWATIAKVTETEIMYTFTLMSYPLPFTCNSEIFAMKVSFIDI